MDDRFYCIGKPGISGYGIEYRKECYTGFVSRIAPLRIRKKLAAPPESFENIPCPFCSPQVHMVTPTFPDGSRFCRGESVTFPNRFPFARFHTVTVITKDHRTESFLVNQIADALHAQVTLLRDEPGFPSINWNYLVSAGASLNHPHMQGLADDYPCFFYQRYLEAGRQYFRDHGILYRDSFKEEIRQSPQYLFGDDLFWYAHPVPAGERDIRCLLPFSEIGSFIPYINRFAEDLLRILHFYRATGSNAFTLSLFFDEQREEKKNKKSRGYTAFCIIIARINPNRDSRSDSTYMERIHLEPVIMTSPERVGEEFRSICQGSYGV
ncbi:MAG: galactose-1-phosphate uridylyltransferase [Methanospirillaceae archaeon]|nr:galactose-1-phosphate uridylyltransferase [Methanospirillaceae archaeon]